jgi:hypothetical protein
MSKSDKLSIPFRVYHNEIYFSRPFGDNKKIKDFIAGHEGKKGEVTYKIIENAAYYQYKYFFGFVVKYIAMAQGEHDINYVKEVLKEDYLFIKVSDKKEIPKRHLKKCRIIERERRELGQICRDDNSRVIYDVVGYIPSLSVLDFKELEGFIKMCVFIGLTDWSMGEEDKKEELECIKRIKSFEIDNK